MLFVFCLEPSKCLFFTRHFFQKRIKNSKIFKITLRTFETMRNATKLFVFAFFFAKLVILKRFVMGKCHFLGTKKFQKCAFWVVYGTPKKTLPQFETFRNNSLCNMYAKTNNWVAFCVVSIILRVIFKIWLFLTRF